MGDPTFAKLKSRLETLESCRRNWESQWQDLRNLIFPRGRDFTSTNVKGEERQHLVFEGTAGYACEIFASGLHANQTSPTERWFALGVRGMRSVDMSADVRAWLDLTSDSIYEHLSYHGSQFNNSIQEVYRELGMTGNGCLYQEWNEDIQTLRFRAIPLADVWIDENVDGMVDTIFRKVAWTTRQVHQKFQGDDDRIPKKIAESKQLDKVWEIIHAVFPRDDKDEIGADATKKKFASFWFCREAPGIIRNSGFDSFPYHFSRWSKIAGEVYGRGPGNKALPDIRMLNAMEKTQIRAVQKEVDPPILVPSDGFIMPIRTTPSSLLIYDSALAGPDALRPLQTGSRVDVGEGKMDQKREHIMRCFYVEWLLRSKKKERQTATEVLDERDEMLQMMGANLGRQNDELHGPMLSRCLQLLAEHNKITPPPDELKGVSLQVIYQNPAARAQQARKGLGMRRYLEEMIPVMQVDPTVLDGLNLDVYAADMAVFNDVPQRVIRSPEEIEQIREGRQQAQQAQQMAEIAEPASKAIDNVASAQSKGMDVLGLIGA